MNAKTACLRVNKVHAYELPNGQLFRLLRDARPHAVAHKLNLKMKRAEKRIRQHLLENELNVSACLNAILLFAPEIRTYINFYPHTPRAVKDLESLTASERNALISATTFLRHSLKGFGLDDIHILDFVGMYRKDITMILDLHKTDTLPRKDDRGEDSLRAAA